MATLPIVQPHDRTPTVPDFLTNERSSNAWHPWAGKMVGVHEVIRRPTGAIARCTAVEGEPAERAKDHQVWMLDPAWCQRMRPTDEPVASIEALMVLRDLLIDS